MEMKKTRMIILIKIMIIIIVMFMIIMINNDGQREINGTKNKAKPKKLSECYYSKHDAQ